MDGFKLYVSSDESEDETKYKRLREEDQEVVDVDAHEPVADVEHLVPDILGPKPFATFSDTGSDSDLDSEDWEDIDISPNSFTVQILDKATPSPRRLAHLEERKRRIAIRYLGIVTYILHAFKRNIWLNSYIVHKKIKKILPRALLKRKKAFWKKVCGSEFKCTSVDTKELIYLLKYAMKWFILNYRLDCNGLRVLGYLPKEDVQFAASKPDEYFPSSKPINSVHEFANVASKMKHNRDTGAQIFTAILRGLGFQARLVFSLPCLPIQGRIKDQPRVEGLKLSQSPRDNDLLYPYYWTEVVNPLEDSELYIIENISSQSEDSKFFKLKRYSDSKTNNITSIHEYYTLKFYPKPDQFNQMTMHYVFSFTNQGTFFESSARYLPDIAYRFFKKLDLRTAECRSALLVKTVCRILNSRRNCGISQRETQCLRRLSLLNCSIPTSFAAMKRNHNVTTPSTLRYNETIPLTATLVGTVKKISEHKKEKVFLKSCLIVGKSVQQWKMLGRSIKPEEIDFPIKSTILAPPRTVLKKRRYNLNVFHGSESQNTMNLYGYHQTCKYIPLSIGMDGKLPRNEYGNIEIFRPWMLPKGCSWLKMNNIADVLRELPDRIEFVPVVTGFSFSIKAGFAVPIKEGVIVSEANEADCKRKWFAATFAKNKRNREIKELRSLAAWKIMMKGIRISKRLDEYDWN